MANGTGIIDILGCKLTPLKEKLKASSIEYDFDKKLTKANYNETNRALE